MFTFVLEQRSDSKSNLDLVSEYMKKFGAKKEVADGVVSSTETGRDSLINSNFDKRVSEKKPSVNSKPQKINKWHKKFYCKHRQRRRRCVRLRTSGSPSCLRESAMRKPPKGGFLGFREVRRILRFAFSRR